MILRNWLSFARKHTGLFAMLMAIQILSLVCIFFVFGIYQNNIYELSATDDTKSLSADLKGSRADAGTLRELLYMLVEEQDLGIDYLYLRAVSSDGKYTYEDRAQYEDGKIHYSDYVWGNMKMSMEGRVANEEEYADASRVVVTNPDMDQKIGDTMQLGGKDYTVIGIDGTNGEDLLEIPFTAFPEDSQWQRVSAGLTMLPTREQYEAFKEYVEAAGAEAEDFYVVNGADLKRERSMMVVSVLLAVLSAGNMYMIYRFLFRRRRKTLAVYRLCGCSSRYARTVFFGEIVINTVLAAAAGVLLFRFAVYPLALSWFSYINQIYHARDYVVIPAVFTAVALGSGYFLSRSVVKESMVELGKEE